MSNLGQFFGGDSNIRNIYPLDGPFGTGKLKFFYRSGTFTVPNGISTVRVRMWGSGYYYSDDTSLATSSFGNYCSATGPQEQYSNSYGFYPSPGEGIGGDINSSGGTTSNFGSAYSSYGGGGAGNLFGNGGVTSGNGGAGENYVGGSGIIGDGGYVAFNSTGGVSQIIPATGHVIGINSIDLIGCGGGGYPEVADGLVLAGNGVNGGGGGRSNTGIPDAGIPGLGGFPGGGNGANFGEISHPGAGFCLKTITGLTPDTVIDVRVGDSPDRNRGLVIVEY